MYPKKATHQQTKRRNRDLVLKLIFERDPISRAEVARITNLTRATVSEIVASLIEEGLVKEAGYGESLGGKAPILLSLVSDSRYLIGLNLAQDKFIGSVTNLRGEIKETIELPVDGTGGEQALHVVYRILDQLTSMGWNPLFGIGVGTPGLVNTRDGVVVQAVNLSWKDLPLAELLSSRYRLPVTLLNDSQAMAIGEFVYAGSHPSHGNLVVVNVRRGVGAGILINGRLFQGDGGGAGEIGHVVIDENGALCRCGKRGCLETIASATAVVQRAVALAPNYPASALAQNPQGISLDTLESAWRADDPLARQVMSDAAQSLGKSIAGLVSVLNIHRIVLTGDMVRFGETWLQAVRDSMTQASLALVAQDTKLELGTLGFESCVLGAAAFLLLENYDVLFRQPA
jgi:predicted NBD/HSP70 family sugar kinase